jgi:hypothetical protein
MLEETPEAYSVLTLNTSVGWIVRPLDEGRQRIVTPCNFVMQCRGSEAGVVFPTHTTPSSERPNRQLS